MERAEKFGEKRIALRYRFADSYTKPVQLIRCRCGMKRPISAKMTQMGRHPALSALVFLAMLTAAAAFGAGLYFQAGLGPVASAIGGIAIFLVMAASHVALTRSVAESDTGQRLAAIEAAFAHIAKDVERVSQAAAAGEEVETLMKRVESIKPLLEKVNRIKTNIDAEAQLRQLAGQTERIDARLEALRSQVNIESKERHAELTAEFQLLETLVKQLAERVAVDAQNRAVMNEFVSGNAPADKTAGEEKTAFKAAADNKRLEEVPSEGMGLLLPEQDEVLREKQEDIPRLDPGEVESLMLEEVRRSIEANKIELYLQPIMIIPQRRVRYYEALTRLKNESGRMILPNDYISVAEGAGVMPVIDNVMLFRSVQVLRRLEKRSSARGVFCNISVHSLLDPEFFHEFIAFMEQNKELSDSMFFEFGQPVISSCGAMERESLAALASLGFRFSLDQVTSLDVDFQELHDMGFRTVKLSADLFLNGMAEAGARIHAADMKNYLERFGIQLIVEKIEDERTLVNVLDHNVKLGQGYLFSEPRPVRPEVFGAKEEAAA